jgi:hypothetical protein
MRLRYGAAIQAEITECNEVFKNKATGFRELRICKAHNIIRASGQKKRKR